WTWSLIAGVVVVAVVALLLILIIRAANRIDYHANEIWEAGKKIAGNTVSIWMLDKTNAVAADILSTAQSIAGTAGQINQKLDDLGRALTKGS
ncbi:MAG: hypothetical protein ACREEM_47010, partial [Blastocatellia bacterium]